MFILAFICVCCVAICESVSTLKWSDRIDRYDEGEEFGCHLDASNGKAVIGSPLDTSFKRHRSGSVTIYDAYTKERVRLPRIGSAGSDTFSTEFGQFVAINTEFFIATAFTPAKVYVYKASNPYCFVDSISHPSFNVYRWIFYSVDIGADSTIVITGYSKLYGPSQTPDLQLLIYNYDESTSSWHLSLHDIIDTKYRFSAYPNKPVASISGNFIGVSSMCNGDVYRNCEVRMYRRYLETDPKTNQIRKVWRSYTTIMGPPSCKEYGTPLMIDGDRMVVGSLCSKVFVYKKMTDGDLWSLEAVIPIATDESADMPVYRYPGVAIDHGNRMVVTSQKLEGAILYTRKDNVWKEHSVLKAGSFLNVPWLNVARYDGDFVYTGVCSNGSVFVHNVCSIFTKEGCTNNERIIPTPIPEICSIKKEKRKKVKKVKKDRTTLKPMPEKNAAARKGFPSWCVHVFIVFTAITVTL